VSPASLVPLGVAVEIDQLLFPRSNEHMPSCLPESPHCAIARCMTMASRARPKTRPARSRLPWASRFGSEWTCNCRQNGLRMVFTTYDLRALETRCSGPVPAIVQEHYAQNPPQRLNRSIPNARASSGSGRRARKPLLIGIRIKRTAAMVANVRLAWESQHSKGLALIQ